MTIPEILDLTPEQCHWIEEYHRHTSWAVRATDFVMAALHAMFYALCKVDSPPEYERIVPRWLPGEEPADMTAEQLAAIPAGPDFEAAFADAQRRG